MNLRRLLYVSLSVNFILLLAWVITPTQRQKFPGIAPSVPAPDSADAFSAPASRDQEERVAKQPALEPAFHWNEIVSDNPTQMVTNLRFVRCPESTIHLILTVCARERVQPALSRVVGQIYPVYYQVLADSKGSLSELAKAQQEELEKIQRACDDFISAAHEKGSADFGQFLNITREAAQLTDFLEPENARRVAEIQEHYGDEEQRAGNLTNRERTNRLAHLRTERMEALKQVLTLEQLDELDLRKEAGLKQERYLFEATRDEWKTILELNRHTSKTNGSLGVQMLAPLLGAERAQEFNELSDSAYRALAEIVAEAGMPASTVERAAAINEALDKDLEVFQKEPMPESFRAELLNRRKDQAQQELRSLLGPEACAAFLADQR